MPIAPPGSVVASQSVDLWTPGSLTFELLKGVPAAFVALVIGLIAAGIAYRQSQIAHAKLKLDLFERRYELYTLLRDFLAGGMEVPDPHNGPEVRRFNELRIKFFDAVPQAYFLFGREIGEFFELTGQKAGEHNAAWKRLHQLQADAPNRQETEQTVLDAEEWARAERAGLMKRFGEYMSFEQWRG